MEEEEEEEERQASRDNRTPQVVPQTPDQEAFLKQNFVTLAQLSESGTDPGSSSGQVLAGPSVTGSRLEQLLLVPAAHL